MRSFVITIVVAAGLAALLFARSGATPMPSPNDESPAVPPADNSDAATDTATFAAGCFWCTEAVYLRMKGVTKVVSGYSGGTIKNPTYQQICTGLTGHAECIQVEYDPSVVTFEQLLDVFFHTHDPTTLNRQGADAGTQYRSSVFFHNDAQKAAAEKMIAELDGSGDFHDPIVTKLEKLEKFYPAEDYHQDYYKQNPRNGYCQMVVGPKVAKFQKRYQAMLKDPDD
jgi:peptide-methionine (S)-S-oxide reductase